MDPTMSDQPATPATDAQAPAGATQTPTPAPTPTPPPNAPQTPAQQAPPEWDGKVESLPEPVQKMIRDLRSENADKRTKLTSAEQAQQDAIRALAKAAGIELPGDDAAPKPEELAQQLTAAQQAQRQAAVELAVYKAAGTHNGNPAALLDSRSFLAKVADLDPSADDFGAKVDEAIKSAIADNPMLKAARAAGKSGVDHAGGSGEDANPAMRAAPGQSRIAAAYANNGS
jgi:hypothetical protein